MGAASRPTGGKKTKKGEEEATGVGGGWLGVAGERGIKRSGLGQIPAVLPLIYYAS